jgi:hypothetical protein
LEGGKELAVGVRHFRKEEGWIVGMMCKYE